MQTSIQPHESIFNWHYQRGRKLTNYKCLLFKQQLDKNLPGSNLYSESPTSSRYSLNIHSIHQVSKVKVLLFYVVCACMSACIRAAFIWVHDNYVCVEANSQLCLLFFKSIHPELFWTLDYRLLIRLAWLPSQGACLHLPSVSITSQAYTNMPDLLMHA